jgi:hypothetical protein
MSVGFEVLTAVGTKMAVFWVVAPCSLVEVYQRFRGPFCLHYQIALMMEAARTSETLLNFYQTTQRYSPEDSHLQDATGLKQDTNCRNEAVRQEKKISPTRGDVQIVLILLPLKSIITSFMIYNSPCTVITKLINNLRFQALTTAIMKMTLFWAVEPCSVVEIYRRCLSEELFSGILCEPNKDNTV